MGILKYLFFQRKKYKQMGSDCRDGIKTYSSIILTNYSTIIKLSKQYNFKILNSYQINSW